MLNGSSSSETIYQRDGFWTKTLAVGAEKLQKIFGSGTYFSACIPGQWKAPIRVKPKAPASPATNSFRGDMGGRCCSRDVALRGPVQDRPRGLEAMEVGDGSAVGDLRRGEREDLLLQGPNREDSDKKTDWSPAPRVQT
jgi:hypothetical protein